MLKIHPHRAFIDPAVSVSDVDEAGHQAAATLRVDGLLCSLCATNVEGRLKAVDGVHEATVDLDSGRAAVRYDAGRAAPDDFIAAAESAVILRPIRRLLGKLGGSAA